MTATIDDRNRRDDSGATPTPPRRWPWIVAVGVLSVLLLASLAGREAPPQPSVAAPVAAPVQAPVAAYTPSYAPAPTYSAPSYTPEPAYTAAPSYTPPSTTYTYKVTGKNQGSITYSASGGNQSQETDADLPWSKKVDSPGFAGMTFAYVSAQNSGGGTISCQIIGPDGDVVAENSSEGEYAIVTCQA